MEYSQEPRAVQSDFLKSATHRLAAFHTRQLGTDDPALTELHYIQCELMLDIARSLRGIASIDAVEITKSSGFRIASSEQFFVRLRRRIVSWYDSIR